MQLPCQSNFSCSGTTNVQSRESGDRDGARDPDDIQLRKKDTTPINVRTPYTSNNFRLKCALESGETGLNVQRQKRPF